MSGLAIENFWISIAGGVVLLVIDAALKWAYGRLAVTNPIYRVRILGAIALGWITVNSAYVYFVPRYAAAFILTSSAAIAWIARSELYQFWRIGLVGADAQIQIGIDFRKALNLVSNSMDFLGIGAAKLTGESSAFESAIARCQRPDRAVRFLLCRPDNDRLQQMAQSADQDRTSYRKKVEKSLRTIAGLRNDRAWNIQVRFYREFPTFRLMFIDDLLCLASHYVLGKGSGADMPQLHVIKFQGSRDVDSLYYAFSAYFDRFWADAEPWDFKQYLI
jgi:hypothetical protein